MTVARFEKLVLGSGLSGTDNGDESITIDATGGALPADGWVDDTAATWTYASASTFTVTGDRTSEFTKGTRLKFTQTTVKYGIVADSSHAAGTTTVTIIVNTDYVLANAAISANYYSPLPSPNGYPGNFTWAPAPTGFTGAVTIQAAEFFVIGNLCYMSCDFSGTSNATTFTFTPPVAAQAVVGIPSQVCWVQDNSVVAASPGFVNFDGSGNVDIYRTLTLLGWTASGTKRAIFQCFYWF